MNVARVKSLGSQTRRESGCRDSQGLTGLLWWLHVKNRSQETVVVRGQMLATGTVESGNIHIMTI
jgi:hypothetical protein